MCKAANTATTKPTSTLRPISDFMDSSSYLLRARCLAATLCGEGGESFRNYNDEIQANVLWLLAAEIDNAYVAHERESEESRAQRVELLGAVLSEFSIAHELLDAAAAVMDDDTRKRFIERANRQVDLASAHNVVRRSAREAVLAKLERAAEAARS